MAVAKKRAVPASEEPVSRPANRIGREPIPVPRLVPRGKTAFDTVQWRTHDAVIKNAEGKVIFEQKGIRARRRGRRRASTSPRRSTSASSRGGGRARSTG